jgi:predicted DCC family thiol-disulfide oxidoreductase YuxK
VNGVGVESAAAIAAPAPVAEPVALPPRIVLFDGTCGLCDRTVQWLLKRDRDHELWFAPLQGTTAATLRERHPEIPQTLESVVYVDAERDRAFVRSKAFLHMAKHLTRPWRWLYAVRWLPGFLMDLPYRLIARLRYRIWGKLDSCRLPDASEKARLLP